MRFTVLRDEPLARHCAYRTGGPCDAFVVVHDPDSLGEVLAQCRAEKLNLTLLGHGTRSAGRDGGLAGAVLRLGTGYSIVSRDDLRIVAGAATPVPVLVGLAARFGLAGLEEHAATPGSLGASLALDPGWGEVVEEVRYFWRNASRTGTLEDLGKAAKAIVEGVTLRLRQDDPARVAARSRARRRGEVRGLWTPTGAVFEAPKKAPLREVLERAGLNDVRLRDVLIPGLAPELLVNLGGGSGWDLALLHDSAKERVAQTTGFELRSRLQWMGRPGGRS